ncbi:GNAT family N-acetyltransferase [Nocardioides piscis]|uniref:GNAT family N-acetyltransferase n=1 Tax=Nocardioides piscis TaxID=2714938 RepID=A0A6G7YEU6_9ACTN|nr:GNAT family N-acetyltransferase [Nocardioides piscis]QIK75249.1 GNAT family N-acetyltransferase [Nocardioides piscis]
MDESNFVDLNTLKAAVYQAGSPEPLERFFSGGEELRTIGYLAYDAADMACAYYGIFPMHVTRGSSRKLAAQSGSTMTHPHHQGRGLFKTLAAQTFATARQSQIEFVFGFPNRNSYPGFVRSLGWEHRRTMTNYLIPVRTLPFNMARRHSSGVTAWQAKVLRKRSDVFSPTEIQAPHYSSGRGGAVRDAAYLHLRKSGLYAISGLNWACYFKIGRWMEVGDLIATSDSIDDALSELKGLAGQLGTSLISVHTAPGSHLDRLLWLRARAKTGLPYCHLSLNSPEDPDNYDFARIDYDTY